MRRTCATLFHRCRGIAAVSGSALRRPAACADVAQLGPTRFRDVRCFGGRGSKQSPPKRQAPQPLSAASKACVEALQGSWGDDAGLTIEVEGGKARFSDSEKPDAFEELDSCVTLRGARLAGPVAAPVWTSPDGARRNWARAEAAGAGDTVWAIAFLAFQEQRLRVRRKLRDAFAENDFEAVAKLKAEWRREDQPHEGLTEAQSAALAAGLRLVPGTCFRHKKFKYRGVILASDPWCAYPASWRAKWLPNRPDGERQPFFYCLVDERDRQGIQMRYVAQENVEECDVVFPVDSRATAFFLTQHNEMGCYLPGAELEEMLQLQRADSRHIFSLRRN